MFNLSDPLNQYGYTYDTMNPIIYVDVFGPSGSGKTTLSKALRSYCDSTFGKTIHHDDVPVHRDPTDKEPPNPPQPNTAAWWFQNNPPRLAVNSRNDFHYRTATHAFTQSDLGDLYFPRLISGDQRGDIAVFVVAANEDVGAAITDLFHLAQTIEVGPMIVFINKADTVDQIVMETREREIRTQLEAFSFPDYDPPIITGSAIDGHGIPELLNVVDSTCTPRPEVSSLPLRFRIKELIPNREGRVLMGGELDQGILHVGDRIELLGFGEKRPVTVKCLEQIRKPLAEVKAPTPYLVIELEGMASESIVPGQILCAPGTRSSHTDVRACLYVLPEQEGGIPSELVSGDPLLFLWGPVDLENFATVSPGQYPIKPGEISTVDIAFKSPLAIAKGETFQFWSLKKRILAYGMVSAFLS